MNCLKKSILFSFLFFMSCSPDYKNCISPLNNSPRYVQWYFLEKTIYLREKLKKENPTYDDQQLDSLTFLEVGNLMRQIDIEDYARIKKAYDHHSFSQRH